MGDILMNFEFPPLGEIGFGRGFRNHGTDD